MKTLPQFKEEMYAKVGKSHAIDFWLQTLHMMYKKTKGKYTESDALQFLTELLVNTQQKQNKK
jgi:hypothetical protein